MAGLPCCEACCEACWQQGRWVCTALHGQTSGSQNAAAQGKVRVWRLRVCSNALCLLALLAPCSTETLRCTPPPILCIAGGHRCSHRRQPPMRASCRLGGCSGRRTRATTQPPPPLPRPCPPPAPPPLSPRCCQSWCPSQQQPCSLQPRGSTCRLSRTCPSKCRSWKASCPKRQASCPKPTACCKRPRRTKLRCQSRPPLQPPPPHPLLPPPHRPSASATLASAEPAPPTLPSPPHCPSMTPLC